MKKFLFKTFILLLIPIVLYISLHGVLKLYVSNEISKNEIILLGDSHTEFINHNGLLNYSIKGSPFFVHYYFVKEFSKEFKNKKILIAFNYHNFSKLYENRLRNENLYPGWAEPNIIRVNKFNLFYVEKIIDQDKRDNLGLSEYRKKMTLIIRDNLLLFDKINSKKVIKNSDKVNEVINRHWQNDNYIYNDIIQHYYFNEIIEELLRNNNEVILLKMPVTSYYFDGVPERIKNEIGEIAKSTDLQLIDLQFQLREDINDIYFKDFVHLNDKGDSLINMYLHKNGFLSDIPSKSQ